jgi:hypothetical protein
MASETLLFLFAAIGALSGLATMVDVSFKLSDRLLSKGNAPKQIAGRTPRAKTGAIQISRARFAVIVILLLTSGALSIGGVVSTIRREEQLKSSLRPENIEGTIHQWLDVFGFSVQKVSSPPDPAMRFALVASSKSSGASVLVFTRSDIPTYVVLQTAIALGPEDKNKVSKLSRQELDDIANEFITQLAQARVGWLAFDDPPFSKNVTLIGQIPITNGLTAAFFWTSLMRWKLITLWRADY